VDRRTTRFTSASLSSVRGIATTFHEPKPSRLCPPKNRRVTLKQIPTGNTLSPFCPREPVTFSSCSCFLHIQPAVFRPCDKAVILSEALRRTTVNKGSMARSRRTPAMLIGRCYWELSGRKLQRKKKSQKLRAKPRDLQFPFRVLTGSPGLRGETVFLILFFRQHARNGNTHQLRLRCTVRDELCL
jgi:hypothetical protein